MKNKADGFFKDGSLWYGDKEQDESGRWWFMVGDGDYQTQEVPQTFPLFTLVRFTDDTPESTVKTFFAS